MAFEILVQHQILETEALAGWRKEVGYGRPLFEFAEKGLSWLTQETSGQGEQPVVVETGYDAHFI